jgi:hypothetical protein
MLHIRHSIMSPHDVPSFLAYSPPRATLPCPAGGGTRPERSVGWAGRGACAGGVTGLSSRDARSGAVPRGPGIEAHAGRWSWIPALRFAAAGMTEGVAKARPSCCRPRGVMPGFDPGSHAFLSARAWSRGVAGTGPAMTTRAARCHSRPERRRRGGEGNPGAVGRQGPVSKGLDPLPGPAGRRG